MLQRTSKGQQVPLTEGLTSQLEQVASVLCKECFEFYFQFFLSIIYPVFEFQSVSYLYVIQSSKFISVSQWDKLARNKVSQSEHREHYL